MARRHRKRRRRQVAITINPRRRRNPGRYHRRRNPVRYHRRRNPARYHRRRNPEGGVIAMLVNATLAGGAAGAAVAVIDGKLLEKQSSIVKIGAKVALAGAGAALLGKRHPNFARSFVAGIMGTVAYEGVNSALGGVVAPNVAVAAQQMKALIREDPRAMGVLVEARRRQLAGMGAVVDDTVSLSGPLEANALPGAQFQDVRIR